MYYFYPDLYHYSIIMLLNYLELICQVQFPANLSIGILIRIHPIPEEELEHLERLPCVILHQFSVVGEQLKNENIVCVR